MLPMKRGQRALLGAICLVVVALIMGWFVGRYIPGEPREPEPRPGEGLYLGSTFASKEIVDFTPGSTMELRDITQGAAYFYGLKYASTPTKAEITGQEEAGTWSYDCPDIAISIEDTKTIPTGSFAEWFPHYKAANWEVYNNSTLFAVVVSITNKSAAPIMRLRDIPEFTLWSENLAYVDSSLGTGAFLDWAFYFINPRLSDYGEDAIEYEYGLFVNIQPGESQELTIPFKVNKNNLIDQSTFSELNPADFCLQTADYDTGTLYRLWL